MTSRSLLIAIAAFAVTASGVHAYNGTKILENAGLDEKQRAAFALAEDLQKTGDFIAARDVIADSGITAETLLSIHAAAEQERFKQIIFADNDTSATTGQLEAYLVASQANDKKTAQAVLDEMDV